MKFLATILVHLVMVVVFCWGIVLTFKGNYWFLIVSLLLYILAVAKIGCLPKAH